MSYGRRLLPSFLIVLGCLIAPGAIGCSCSTDDSQAKLDEAKKKLEEEKKKKAKPKPDYELKLLTVQPNNLIDRQFYVKPGHWASATVDCVANNFDVHGELSTDPLDLDGVPYALGSSRPITLPKGQIRALEVLVNYPELIPGQDREDLKHFSVRLNSDGGRMLQSTPARLERMPAHQFYFCVLANEPDRYRYLGQMPVMRPMTSATPTDERDAFYRLVLPHVIRRAPLPSMTFGWTQLAYLLWDDVPRDILNEEQQSAMLDWLHFGGQIVISGPGSLNLLKQSFLEPYLPATSTGAVDVTADNLADMRFAEGAGWGLPLHVAKPWACEILTPAADAQVLARTQATTKEGEKINVPLIVERSIGRGRIVVTAFRLTQPELSDWKYAWPDWDSVVNAFLLRRKPRDYRYLESDDAALFTWRAGDRLLVAQSPQEATRLSFFSRDTGAGSHRPAWLDEGDRRADAIRRQRMVDPFGNPIQLEDDDEHRWAGPGPAAWDDWNDVAHHARTSLEEAAGIKVPERTFVLRTLAWYLLFLVPINWAIFGVIRRLEWAWIAVPLITITFTVLVVRWAELNIGFARSRTEVAVVEVHGEHPRAHLARFTALYTSLTTRYEAKVVDRGGVVQPLSGRDQLALFQMNSRSHLWLKREKDADLTGYEVASNTRGMLHAEHMFDLGGPIKVIELTNERVKVRNDSDYTLRGAEVIGPNGVALLRDLEPGVEAAADFDGQPRADADKVSRSPDEEPAEVNEELDAPQAEEPSGPKERIGLEKLLDLARKPDGGVRLVAWSDEALPGLDVYPAASQNRHANVFLVHLRPAPLRGAKPDKFERQEAREAFLRKPTPNKGLLDDPTGGGLEALEGLRPNPQ